MNHIDAISQSDDDERDHHYGWNARFGADDMDCDIWLWFCLRGWWPWWWCDCQWTVWVWAVATGQSFVFRTETSRKHMLSCYIALHTVMGALSYTEQRAFTVVFDLDCHRSADSKPMFWSFQQFSISVVEGGSESVIVTWSSGTRNSTLIDVVRCWLVLNVVLFAVDNAVCISLVLQSVGFKFQTGVNKVHLQGLSEKSPSPCRKAVFCF